MRVGIIAEGRGDLAVITNILKGWLGLQGEDVQFLRPEYSLDQTDLHGQSEEQFSNWGHVRDECMSGVRIDEFLDSPIDERRVLVIHVDTDVADEPGFDVERPPVEPHDEYVRHLHEGVAAQLDTWLGDRVDRSSLGYAIAIEQTDAWVLTLFESKAATSTHRDAKQRLHRVINKGQRYNRKQRSRLFNMKTYRRYHELSKDFRKTKTLARCVARNISLQRFLDELDRWREDHGDDD